VQSPPPDLVHEHLTTALADGWRLRAASMKYLPKGAGSHHWVLAGADGRRHFVTVDDLDGKDWLGGTRQAVSEGLRRALQTAAALRHEAGLEFVVAPLPALDGAPLRRLGDRYAVSVFPFLPGHSYPFGPYPDEALRGQALEMLAALHRSAPAVRDLAPSHVPGFTDRAGLDAFLRDPGRPWDGGPFSAAAHGLAAARAAAIARLTAGFDRLAGATATARAEQVITHGEPHPGNIMHVDGRLVLVDWDTVALAPPERDVSMVVAGSQDIDRYQNAAGREVNFDVVTLYRLRWYLDDLSCAVQMFRSHHDDTPDTRQWWQALAPMLDELPRWLDLLD
jgi:spectinomycin phosphotransferase